MIIATHNVEFLFGIGTHVHSGQQWEYSKELVGARIEHFAKLFSQINADILLLQEVASKTVIEEIIRKSGIGYSYFFANPDNVGVGNVVLYKEKPLTYETIPAVSSLPVFVAGDSDILGSRIWPRRDFVHLETNFKGKTMHVLGVHIKSNFLMPQKSSDGTVLSMDDQISSADGLIRSEMFRYSQAKKLREVIDSLFSSDPKAMIVVAGDYNAEVNDSVYRIIKGVIADRPNSLFATSSRIDKNRRFSMAAADSKPSRLVDHILVSKNIESSIVGVQILNSDIRANNNTAPIPTSIASDHAPIVIELA